MHVVCRSVFEIHIVWSHRSIMHIVIVALENLLTFFEVDESDVEVIVVLREAH